MTCVACFTGEIQDEKPTGKVVKLYERDVYVAEPPQGVSAKGITIMISDAFGWSFVNNRLLANRYAKNGGFRVYLPDFMDGTAAPVSMISTLQKVLERGSVWAWLTKPYYIASTLYGMAPFIYNNSTAASAPKVQTFFQSVREQNPNMPIGAAGFCWGGKHAIDLASGIEVKGTPLVDAVFTAHPSRLAIPSDIEKIKKPTSFALGDQDSVVPMAQVEHIQKVLNDKGDVKSEVVIYPGGGHGFSVRADLHKNEKQAEQAAKAESQAIEWFTKCLS